MPSSSLSLMTYYLLLTTYYLLLCISGITFDYFTYIRC